MTFEAKLCCNSIRYVAAPNRGMIMLLRRQDNEAQKQLEPPVAA
jgi:hypothetical protein